MRMAQKMKLEQLFDNVQAVGRNELDKAWLAERAEQVLQPLQRIAADLNRVLVECQE